MPHIHPSAWLSGVYYVALPSSLGADDDGTAGWIEFGRPYWDFQIRAEPETRLIEPEEGLMLLFPSYMFHRTLPFHRLGRAHQHRLRRAAGRVTAAGNHGNVRMNEQRKLPQEAGYNLRLRHPDFDEYLAVWEAESARVRDSLDCILDVRYGAGPNMTADLFPAPTSGAPIQVFIHGGYWRGMDKDVHSFPAEGFVAAGGAAVSLNYALAPAVTLDTIIEQCRTAHEWVADNAGRLNGDPDRIFVSGHSAGGHLTAMMLCTDWAARGRPADLVKGGTAISGIFDLAPLMETSINDDVRLDAEAAARNSPIHNLPAAGAGGPLIAAVGAAETAAFVAQNRAFAEAWQARGFEATVMEIEGLHHYNVVMEMGRPGSALTQAALTQMGL